MGTDAGYPVVGIGASAGGLDACRQLLDSLPGTTGMAFILVQHLDPTHDSMLVDLLATHTSMPVREATDGQPIEPDHLYVIPPGRHLSVSGGALRLSAPIERRGARRPFDFLLQALAQDCGSRAVCVILSGTGADGSLGAQAVKAVSGLVIAQDPDEAGFDGMPRNAITTGAADLVLRLAAIPDALANFARRLPLSGTKAAPAAKNPEAAGLAEIIDLVRTQTSHDFRLYKHGTLQRRIERRMSLVPVDTGDLPGYLALLRSDQSELERLAKDLLINVTNFFRDPKVFDFLATSVIPDLIANRPVDQPVRIWIVGCSTGEEAYSLAMLFREQVDVAKRNVKLQIFASDVDPDAIAVAREGLYPRTIEADVSPERLGRFFTNEVVGYRASPDLRSTVVFAVQDVLADPPFSRLDLISCRNLLIYLGPEAQEKAIALFHFALRDGGMLLLGASETVGSPEGRYGVVSKPMRLHRRIGPSRPGGVAFAIRQVDGVAPTPQPGSITPPSRQTDFPALCRRLVVENYALAAVLINARYECLYLLGPTNQYLRVASGHPTHDLLSMVHERIRTKIRSTVQQCRQTGGRASAPGGAQHKDGEEIPFRIDVQQVPGEGEELYLICFVDEPKRADVAGASAGPVDLARVAELERELAATRIELQGAIRSLEVSNEEQKAINEEALSVNEEFQSTNEELLTSKEELQSLNEELTSLNGQLQDTLERQRTTFNDLQNVLYSTDVATLFLDSDLNIRFFTPATNALFSIIPRDIGRPLADLNSSAPDGALLGDAAAVLETLAPIEREIQADSGVWYVRRIMPYRAQGNRIEGIVVTFVDVTERKRSADALDEARQQAEQANIAKSRFLAAASHDLRQPLQTLSLLQGQMSIMAKDKPTQKLVEMFDQTLRGMSDMLNTLLDLNQIEAGIVRPTMSRHRVDDLLGRLKDAFTYNALAHGTELRVVPCSQSIYTDPHLLEQVFRNLISNALKYTHGGKVLVGCRKHGGTLSIEVWDTGQGIPKAELQAIFEEYRQLDTPDRQRNRGLGLGLSIVKRLGELLDHRIHVRSTLGKGSVFAVEVGLASGDGPDMAERRAMGRPEQTSAPAERTGTILIIEDDPEVRTLLEMLLNGEGHVTKSVPDSEVALDMVVREKLQPDLVLADYNLPNDMNGLQVVATLRRMLGRPVPGIILTGDISAGTLRDVTAQSCVHLNKPVRANDLSTTIQRLLAAPLQVVAEPVARIEGVTGVPGSAITYIVDDDHAVRAGLRAVLEAAGRAVEDYESGAAFLKAYRPGTEACLLVDAYLPGMSGIELLDWLKGAHYQLPAIVITGNSDVRMAVQAMKAGAVDFIEKPINRDQLLAGVERAFEKSKNLMQLAARREDAANRLAKLTARQRQVLEMVVAGDPSKVIADALGLSLRTVENHRAAILERTGLKSVPDLARMLIMVAQTDADEKSHGSRKSGKPRPGR